MLDVNLLERMIAEGYVNKQKHPSKELYIYNYSAKAQYEQVWNEVTLICRGLILDNNGNIIARPFKKFFNLDEREDQVIPNEPFEVYDKLDGSLGILYWIDDEIFIATRGSFNSIQAIKANELLNGKYAHTHLHLKKNKTYLFEIIYPQNRIVINYGGIEELILLAIVDINTGSDDELDPNLGFPLVKRYDGINDIFELKQLEEDNKEGFVIKFKNDFRLKVKFDEYVRIHKIITQVSSIVIWEYLKEGKELMEIIERVPDEFYDWVKRTKKKLEDQFDEIERTAKFEYKEFPTRKETALYFLECTYPHVLFAMLNKKDHKKNIWKMLRPEYERPFVNDEEI